MKNKKEAKIMIEKKGKKVVLKPFFILFVLVFAILLSFNLVSAAITCATGTVDTTCMLNTTYVFADGEVISGAGTLIINSTGSIANNSNNVSAASRGAGVFINFSNIILIGNSNITGGNITLLASNISIDVNSKIYSSNLGYRGGSGPGKGSIAANRASGGSHGNSGGQSSAYLAGTAYGSSLNPTTFGSGGGYDTTQGNFAGSGGGIVKINSVNLTLDGQILVNGQNFVPATSYCAGGSGGSIWITTDYFSGTGYVQSNGGNGMFANSGTYAGGGSGGRIAIYYNQSDWTGLSSSSVTGGLSSGIYGKAEAGSFIISKMNENSAIIFEGFRFQNTSTIANESQITTFYNPANPNYYNFTNLTIISPTQGTYIYMGANNLVINITNIFNNDLSRVMINNTVFNSTYNYTLNFPRYDSLYLNNSALRSKGFLTFVNLPFLNNNFILENSGLYSNAVLTLQNLNIDSNSKLDASYVGYAGGAGPGTGSIAGNRASGAAYGNLGGQSSAYSAPVAYGSSLTPNAFGSGGGYDTTQGNYAGAGGGLIKINSANLTLDGQILVNGQNFVPATSYCAGGSGGSLWITTNSLFGSGYVQSTGGNGMFANSGTYAGGGSGGRIAIYYNNSNWTGLSSSAVTGGTSSGTYGKAEPGTFIVSKMNENSAIIFEGFRFQNTSTIANESQITTFYNPANPNYYNFTNLSIVSPSQGTFIYMGANNLFINVTNTFNNDLSRVMINNTVFNSTYNYTLNFPRYDSLYLNNSILKAKDFLKFINFPFLTGSFGMESSTIYANIVLSLQNLNVDANSKIDASYLGYGPNTGPGAGSVASGRAYGAGHGNLGGRSSDYVGGGIAYGSSLSPNTFGSGGGYMTGQTSIGGSGGGIIKINSANLTLNGQIISNGQNFWGSYSAGGSGGSIWITTDIINGTGNLQSIGGNSFWNGVGDYGGGGSGGRIAVYYNQSTWSGIFSSNITGGTASGSTGLAEPGTFIFSKVNENSAIIYQGFRFENSTTIANETQSTTFYNLASPTYYNFTNLTILSPSQGAFIYMAAENLLVNITNVFNNDLSRVMFNNTIVNSSYNYTFDFPRYNSLYLNNSILRTRNFTKFVNLPFLSNNLIMENSGIYANLVLSLQNINIDANSKIDASYIGYGPNTGPGAGSVASGRAYGAGHGNIGGRSSDYIASGVAYGSSLSPNTFGSGGGYMTGQNSLGGSGGGIIKINSANLTLNGQILSNGQTFLGSYSAGGSGGSIWITTDSINGSGNFQSIGGNGAWVNSGDYGGGGSGGRIAVYYNQSTWSGIFSSNITGGVASGSTGLAEPGTFIFSKVNENSAIIFQGFRFQNTTTITNETISTTFYNTSNPRYYSFTNLTILSPRQSTLINIGADNLIINITNTFNNDLSTVMINNTVFNSTYNYTIDFPRYTSLYLNNSVLRTRGTFNFITFPSLNGNFNLENSSLYANFINTLQNLTIDLLSRIDASYLGYAQTTGPGAGAASSGRGSGGGHGNLGGASSSNAGGSSYGLTLTPNTFGSGGGYLTSQTNGGGWGGGVIKINLNNLTLDGQIAANGQTGFAAYSGGGGGGSIWITTNLINGNGTLQAIGGNSIFESVANYPGGGSGGRIAVYYNQSTWLGLSNSKVLGGTASGNYGRGGDGTFAFLQAAAGDYSFLNSPINNSGFRNSFIINISLVKENLQNLTYIWNRTSYTIFDKNILYLSFNNMSSLFENENRIMDSGIYENLAGAGRNYTSSERFLNFDFYNVNWTAINLTYYALTRGIAVINLNSTSNPSMAKDIVNFNSTRNNMEIKYKSYTNGPNVIKLYYIDNTDCAAYGETCAQSFNILNDNDWHVLNVTITDPNWIDNDGLIDQIRLNFNGATSTLGSVYLDNIRFYSNTSQSSVPIVVDGKYGKAKQFDGNVTYLEIEDHASLNFRQTDFTIMSWIKLNNSGLNYILNKGNGSDRYGVYINNGKLNFQLTVNNLNVTSSDVGNSTSDDAWHQVAIVFQRNGNAIRYLDGVQIGTTDITGVAGNQNNPSSLLIGKSMYNLGYFNGSIDELYIFNRTLNSGEINNLYSTNLYEYNDTLWYFYKNQTDNQGIYQYSLSSGGEAFTLDASDTRRTILDFTSPNMTDLLPVDNYYINNNSINFSGNASDNLLIRNVSLYLNGVLNQTINYLQDVAITPVGIVVSLADGIYNWFFNIFDYAGNFFNTSNKTTIIDTVNPLINFTDPTPDNLAGRSGSFEVNATIYEINLANVTFNFNGTKTVYNTSSAQLTNLSNGYWIFNLTQGNLRAGEVYSYYLNVTDLGNNVNSTEIRSLGANLAPSFKSVTNRPDENASIKPGTEIAVTVNVSDTDYNLDSAVLYWKNSTADWADANKITMQNQTPISTVEDKIYLYTIFNASFILPAYEGGIMYRVVANDTLGDSSNSTIHYLSSFWDCSWRLGASELTEVSGFYEDKNIGAITVYNTGDPSYPGNCSLNFTLSMTSFNSDYNVLVSDYNLWASSRRYLDFDRTISLSAGENKTVQVLASFPSVTSALSIQHPIIQLLSKKDGEIFNDTLDGQNIRNVTTTIFVLPSGPYLYLNSVNNSIDVYLTAQEFNFSTYIRNMGGNGQQKTTAYNVSVNFTLPEILEVLQGNSSYSFENITNNSIFNYMDFTVRPNSGLLESASLESKNIYFTAEGYNSSGDLIRHYGNTTMINDSIKLNFICYPVKDDVCVNACINLTEGLVYDPDCALPTSTTTVTIAGGAGGGGGGGGASGATVIKSEANYELLRGGKQNFQLEVKNKYGDEMKNINITVSGLNSEYISISPATIDSLAPGAKRNVTVTISAPGYFGGTKYTLIFDITGSLVSNATSGALAAVTDKRYVTLYIVEVDRKDATLNINESESLIAEMNASGLITKEVSALLANQIKAYGELNFLSVKNIYDQIKKIRDNAFESKQLIEEITASIAESEKNGITITESKKSLYLAQVAFNRGDYALALERLKEAKLVYALEIKGELNLIYTIKNNPGKSFSIAIFAGLFGWGSSLLIRLRLYKRKLKNLGEEEVLLLELMKMVQRQCFEEKRMSMEEYDQAMIQYESKLSETIENKIRTETKIANLLKARGKRKALDQEKARLIELIRKVQDDYLNKNKIETRIYEGMIKSYSSRLTEVDEQLAYVEAQDALKKQSKINNMFKV